VKRKPKLLTTLISVFFVGLVSTFLLFLYTSYELIGKTIQEECVSAKNFYGGTCAEALSILIDDTTRSFKKRNRAIWALGHLGDPQALPVLEKYFTEVPEGREPVNSTLSQYELYKAINQCKGATNLPRLVWQRLLIIS
jgi:hypothetical protein